jgi:hypothetical protein
MSGIGEPGIMPEPVGRRQAAAGSPDKLSVESGGRTKPSRQYADFIMFPRAQRIISFI